MRLLSARQQFIADHSSTNYLFFAAKPLSKATRAYINTLSSHVDVGSRKAALQYHGDYADLGAARRTKFLEHYDVEVRESYDWWTLSVMLDADKVKTIKFTDYEVEGEASLTFAKQGKRICVCFDGWQQDYGASYEAFGEDTMEALAELGLALREELYAGETDALQVMHDYCADGEVSGGNSEVGHQLASILEAY